MFEDLIGLKLPIMMVLGDWNLLEAKKERNPEGLEPNRVRTCKHLSN